eukprot:gene36803-45405_t
MQPDRWITDIIDVNIIKNSGASVVGLSNDLQDRLQRCGVHAVLEYGYHPKDAMIAVVYTLDVSLEKALDLLRQHQVAGEAAPQSLLQQFVQRILKSPCTEPVADWVAICNFVISNCDVEAQATVAIYLGGKMVLGTLNHLIKNVVQEQQGLLPRLRSCAVYACVHKNQSTQDVMNVVDWVVRDEHAELMSELKPKLLTLCNTPALFRSLFALPSVVAAMKTDSPISADLESLVQ